MNRKCVYTALTGSYDKLMQPKYVDNEYDYICFSNDIKLKNIGIWQIRTFPFQHKDNTRVSRYPKFHPHVLLKEYEYCIYIDANIIIADDYIYRKADDLFTQNKIVGHIKHLTRNCVYQEVFTCMLLGLDKMIPLIKTLNLYIREGLPFKAGLYENNVIYFSQHKKILKEALDYFWSLYSSYSRRDQLSLRLVYYKMNISPSLLLPDNEDTWNSSHFIKMSHAKGLQENNRLLVNRLKIKIVRLWFLIKGYDLSHKNLHKDLI